MENAKKRLRVAFEFFSKLGVKYWTFHDRFVQVMYTFVGPSFTQDIHILNYEKKGGRGLIRPFSIVPVIDLMKMMSHTKVRPAFKVKRRSLIGS